MSEAVTESTVLLAPVEDPFHEVVNGLEVEKTPMGAYEGWVASVLFPLLADWARTSRLGRVVTEILFVLDPTLKLQRRPDLAFVSYERWPRKMPVPKTNAWDVVPDLAIEVISPSNRGNEIIGKIREYFQAGVRQVWVLYPVDLQIYVYTSLNRVEIFQPEDEIDGGPILPGFRLPISRLFETDND